jgi:cell wall-associated NlpC family hydrolase
MRSRQPQPGDHVFVNRNLYSHHGVCCGDGSVIHYDSSLLRPEAAVVCTTSLAEFAGGAAVYVRQYASCDPRSVVLRRARSRLGERRYHLLFNNCEHFAAWCKTGTSASSQVSQAVSCLAAVGLRAASVPLLVLPALTLVPAALGLSLVTTLARRTNNAGGR